MLGMDSGAVCATCHVAGEAGGRAAVTMRQLIDTLDSRFDAAHQLLTRAERAGMEVSQALFELEAARNAQVAARTAMHGLVLDSVRAAVDTGLVVTEAGVAAGERALRELTFRRAGLAVSVAFILALIAALVAKIRQLDGKAGRSTPESPEADDAR
jgi:hypothetical protein